MTKNEIAEIICSIANVEKVDFSESLILSGKLDSFSLLVLISKLEIKFDLSINMEGVNNSDFESVNTIHDLLIKNKL